MKAIDLKIKFANHAWGSRQELKDYLDSVPDDVWSEYASALPIESIRSKEGLINFLAARFAWEKPAAGEGPHISGRCGRETI